MRFFLDTEFFEDGHEKPVRLISLGICAEDGREYYAELSDIDLTQTSPWIWDNVVPHLTGPRKRRKVIAEELVHFCGEAPEFWAYFADYDWVVFCQLFGRMIDLPRHFPQYCMDLKQLMKSEDIRRDALPAQQGTEHNALADARWCKEAWEWLHGVDHGLQASHG